MKNQTKRYQNVKLEDKRKCNGTKHSAQRHEKFKEYSYVEWKKGSGDLRVKQHLVKLPTCDIELKKSLSSEETHQPQKTDANIMKRVDQIPSS